jgi:hypothetical protein
MEMTTSYVATKIASASYTLPALPIPPKTAVSDHNWPLSHPQHYPAPQAASLLFCALSMSYAAQTAVSD